MNNANRIKKITAELKTVLSVAEGLTDQVKRLEANLRLGRGTGDVGEAAVAARGLTGRYHIGDNTDTDILSNVVERVITEKPCTLHEIVEATGARRNRISGVLVKLQVNGAPVENLGNGRAAVWSIKKPNEATVPRRTRSR